MLEAVAHHVDPLEVHRRQVQPPRGEVRGDGRVVLRAGEDGDRQLHRTLRQPAVLLLVVGGGGLQNIVKRRLVLSTIDVQDRCDLLVRQVGGGMERGQDLVEVVGRIRDADG